MAVANEYENSTRAGKVDPTSNTLKYFPRELVDKPKMGFGVPLDSWLRGDFLYWAESLQNEDRIRRAGYLNPKPIREKWREDESSACNWQYHLWNVLMFQTWLEAQS